MDLHRFSVIVNEDLSLAPCANCVNFCRNCQRNKKIKIFPYTYNPNLPLHTLAEPFLRMNVDYNKTLIWQVSYKTKGKSVKSFVESLL